MTDFDETHESALRLISRFDLNDEGDLHRINQLNKLTTTSFHNIATALDAYKAATAELAEAIHEADTSDPDDNDDINHTLRHLFLDLTHDPISKADRAFHSTTWGN